MAYLIIVAILILAIAPILHFRPTRRQRLITELRDAALENGLFVEFRKDLIFDKCILRLGAECNDVIFYGLRIPLAVGVDRKKVTWLREEEGWSSTTKFDQCPIFLNSLPIDVLAASADIRCYGVYWTERGNEKDVENISRVLTSWAADKD